MASSSAGDNSPFKVKGLSPQTRSQSMYVEGNGSPGNGRPTSAATTSHITSSLDPVSDGSSETQSEASGNEIMSQVVAVNKTLVQQIDALRLRLEIDYKHNKEQRDSIVEETDAQLEQKNAELSNLKSKVEKRTAVLTHLTDNNDKKNNEIEEIQRQIEDLRRDVEDTRVYADELESEVSTLQRDKGKLQTGSAYQEKEDEIRGLHREIGYLRKNLSRFEKELVKAKEVISQHGGKLRLLEKENKNVQVKFREELNKVSLNMRLEIGKMRELMRSQWREMKELREQNESMRSDIKQIRDMLVEQSTTKASATIDEPPKTPLKEHHSQHEQATPKEHAHMAFKPSLPALSKDSKRTNVHSKKK
ncbi:serine/threonine-protein kinase MRCK beta-like [Haliotis rufescens]|uniref:serine/threonine-protein kinase MRCK beta-like n=1 Tax=Haliotis rufescens TaxID=6454 RepID=UPI001EAFE7E3|nr:serine/threonine-protein kinase MRCK beta-like [Haliotis rufescens]